MLCVVLYCVCLCREQPHLVPVGYGRPAAVPRQSDTALGRLKVTVAQVCMCLHCNCVGFCVWVLPTPQDSCYVYTRYNSEPQLSRLSTACELEYKMCRPSFGKDMNSVRCEGKDLQRVLWGVRRIKLRHFHRCL